MKAKRVRLKESESEPNHPENSRHDVCSAACEVREGPSMQPAASNVPKTSEFSFFKKLKQDVGRSYGRNLPNRESIPVKDIKPSSHSRNLGNLTKDVKSSQYVKKSNSGKFGSFLSKKDVALQSSATPSKEHDNQTYKCSSLVKTPTRNSLDLFLSTTANASVNPDPESQQKDGDIFSSKRLKLLQRIARTFFPDADEVPKECDLVSLLLSRLLPENSQENRSQNLQSGQPKTKEKCQLHCDSNIELGEDLNTRKLVKVNNDHFLDRGVSADQSHRFWGSLPSSQIFGGNDASAARNSDRMLLGHKIGSELGTSSNNIAYGCGSERFGDGNPLTWGDEVFDYPTPSNISSKKLKDEAYKQFSNDAFGNNWSCRFKDHSHSFEVLTNPFAAAKSSSHLNIDGLHDLHLDIGPQLSLSSWYDSSRVSFEGFRPSALSHLRDYTDLYCVNDFENKREFCPRLIGWNNDKLNVHDSTQNTHPNCLNDFEFRREFCPRLIGWNTDELNGHDSVQNNYMEIELYHPPSYTCSKALQSSPPKLEICWPSSSWREDPWVSLEKRTLLHLSPYNHQNHDLQAHNSLQKDLVPNSPYIPFKTSHGSEQLNPDDSGLSISKGSSFIYTPRKDYQSVEDLICGRNSPTVKAFHYLQRLESNNELKSKQITGLLTEQFDKHTDNVLELFRPGYSSLQFLTEDEDNLAIFQPEHRSITSVHVPINQEDFLPLPLHSLKWRDSASDDDR